MIGRLQGLVVAEEPEGGIVLDVGGVGYDLFAPVGTLGRAQRVGTETLLHVHTHVREDALDLFAFATENERRVFRLLLGVPNVGPKTALGVLSALSIEALAEAVQHGDVVRLGKVPGIGKKTSERLILELKEKLGRVVAGPVPQRSQKAGGNHERLLGALTNMGYRPAEADRAIKSLGERVEKEPIAGLLREALARLTP